MQRGKLIEMLSGMRVLGQMGTPQLQPKHNCARWQALSRQSPLPDSCCELHEKCALQTGHRVLQVAQ